MLCFLGGHTRNITREKNFLSIKVPRNVIILARNDNLYCERHSGKHYVGKTITKGVILTTCNNREG